MYNPIEYRQTERDAFCRGCDKQIKKKTEKVIYTYSWRNRGQNILICLDCVGEINRLIKGETK